MQTERDWEIVDWLGRLGAATAEQVMRRFGLGRSQTYARLAELESAQLLVLRPFLYRQAGLYVATRRGLRWCGLERLGYCSVSVAGFAHARHLAEVAVELHALLPEWRQLSERELRVAEADADELIGSARVGELPGGRAALHRPDLLLISPSGRSVAIELELSVKDRRRLHRICRGYARARHLHRVYYLAVPAPARAVQRAVAEVRAGDRIRVLALEEISQLAALETEDALAAGA